MSVALLVPGRLVCNESTYDRSILSVGLQKRTELGEPMGIFRTSGNPRTSGTIVKVAMCYGTLEQIERDIYVFIVRDMKKKLKSTYAVVCLSLFV